MLASSECKTLAGKHGDGGVAEMVIPDNGSGKLEAKANSFAWSEIFKKPLITFLSVTCTVNAFISTSLYHDPLSAN